MVFEDVGKLPLVFRLEERLHGSRRQLCECLIGRGEHGQRTGSGERLNQPRCLGGGEQSLESSGFIGRRGNRFSRRENHRVNHVNDAIAAANIGLNNVGLINFDAPIRHRDVDPLPIDRLHGGRLDDILSLHCSGGHVICQDGD